MTKYIFILLSYLGCAEFLSATQVAPKKEQLFFERKPQHQKTNEPLFLSQIKKKKRSQREEEVAFERSSRPRNVQEAAAFGEWVRPIRTSFLPLEATIMPALEPDPELEKSKKNRVSTTQRQTDLGREKEKAAVAQEQRVVQERQSLSLESVLHGLPPEQQAEMTLAYQNLFGPRSAPKRPVATEIARSVYKTLRTKVATAEALRVSAETLNNLLDGDEMKVAGPRVLNLFKTLRENRMLTKQWGLDEDTISRLGKLARTM